MPDARPATTLDVLRTKKEFLATWAPVIGEDTASTYVKATNRLALASFLTPVWGILLVVQHAWEVLALALALLSLAMALAASGLVVKHRYNKLLSARLGARVWALNSPTLRDGQFQRWCAHNGAVVPTVEARP